MMVSLDLYVIWIDRPNFGGPLKNTNEILKKIFFGNVG